MTSGPDPLESLLRAARDAFSPLESGLKNLDLLAGFAPSRTNLRPPPPLDAAALSTAKRNPVKSFLASILPKPSANPRARKRPAGDVDRRDEPCSNCLHFAVAWSLLLDGFAQALPIPIKSPKKPFKKPRCSTNSQIEPKASDLEEREKSPLDFCCSFLNLPADIHKFDQKWHEMFDQMKIVVGLIKGKKAGVDGFLSSLVFARVGGAPPSLAETVPAVKDEGSEESAGAGVERGEVETSVPQRLSALLNIPLSNVERLRSTLSTVSLTELVEFIPQLGGRSSVDHPDKKKLFSVQAFFQYTESEGRRFFEELDRDGDGQVTLEDLQVAMKKRRLPRRYARDFLRRTRRHLFSKSIGWKQFLTLMEQKEATILRAYTTLCLNKSGTLQKNQILTSLRSAGLPASEDNAVAMMRYLNADTQGSISYGHFRNFMLLLPSERLEDDPRSIWFEAATLVAVPPPVEISAENVLKSALAGGLACALSTSVLHPIDTMKTRVQASTLSFPELLSMLPQIGPKGLYRGSIPAILGQFSSHGLRTGIFEASKLVLINVAPTLPEIQVQSLASFCSTVLGTAVRIPCEVLKQRLQAGIFDNVGEAIVGTMEKDGLKGFFRGTGATLCREVPFYVAGMGLYAEAKKVAQNLLKRDLEPWETIMVGALSGGLAAVVTTPFDVIKTRMMTAPQGMPVSMQTVAISILLKEGPLGLFKGAVPRFFWIAPLGAMNFAGYELAKKAMVNKSEDVAGDQLQDKRLTS